MPRRSASSSARMWSETQAGTNGMGTCLAAASPIAVRREDHFFTQLHRARPARRCRCYDPSGAIAAVLDVTSRSVLAQQHLLVLLGMTARMIENRLMDARLPDAHPLHFHSRPEFVYTLHEGRLALAEDGRILAANRSALLQLGVASVEEIRARRIDDIFQTSLADMLERSSSASFHPVVTYRAHAAHRFFAVARRPAGAMPAPRTAPRSTAAQRPAAVHGAGLCRRAARRPARDGAAPHRAAHALAAERRDRLGQGGVRPRRARREPKAERRLRRRQLRQPAGKPDRGRALRLPRRRLHRRPAQRTSAARSSLADGGTLFLDEIGDMPLELQARLLRVLDERQVTPLGAEETQAVDFQLISASHRHLPERVRDGRFREDLYYRIAGIELQLPALRERGDKRELMQRVLAEEAGAGVALSAPAERALLEHPWPGNVRQLRHVLRGAAALADGRSIGREHLSGLLDPVVMRQVAAAAPHDGATADAGLPRLNPIQANERCVLLQLLEQHRWNVSHVAKVLDISRNTLYRKLHKLHIAVSHPA